MSQKKEHHIPNQVRIGLISFLVIFIYLWFYGLIPWGLAYIQCGQKPDVKSGGLFGNGKVMTPSQPGYGPSPFSRYSCPQ